MAGAFGGAAVPWLSGCAAGPAPHAAPAPAPARTDSADLALLNRVSWGVDSAAIAQWNRGSRRDYLEAQLHPAAAPRLAPTAQAQLDALKLAEKPMAAWVVDMEQRRRDADAIADDDAKKAAQQAWQQDMNRLARDAATQWLLPALYSPNQLQEQPHLVLVQPLQRPPVQVEPAGVGGRLPGAPAHPCARGVFATC